MKELSESTNEELLKIKKWLTAVIIVSPIMIIIFGLISYFTGYGSMIVSACVMIPNIILCYFLAAKIDKELKLRGL